MIKCTGCADKEVFDEMYSILEEVEGSLTMWWDLTDELRGRVTKVFVAVEGEGALDDRGRKNGGGTR